MGRVLKRPEKRDRDAVYAVGEQTIDPVADLVLIELDDDVASLVNALGHFDQAAPGDKRWRLPKVDGVLGGLRGQAQVPTLNVHNLD